MVSGRLPAAILLYNMKIPPFFVPQGLIHYLIFSFVISRLVEPFKAVIQILSFPVVKYSNHFSWFPVQNMHYILSSPLYLFFCNLGDIQLSWVSRVNMLLSAEAQEYILSEKWAVESGVGVDQLWL